MKQRLIFTVSLLFLCRACADHDEGGSQQAAKHAQCVVPKTIERSVGIPAGAYRIGDERFYPEEAPVQTVRLSAFEIDATEVTNGQFRSFVDATGYVTRAEQGLPESEFEHLSDALRAPGSAVFIAPLRAQSLNSVSWWAFVAGANWRQPNGPGSTIDGMDNYPVVHVAFEDAKAYADWLGRRLPTEAEWEAAARANQEDAPYSWGDKPPSALDDQPANTWQGLFPVINQKTDGYEGLAPVGCYPPNEFGLYDMVGNIWEMTSDTYFHTRPPPDIAILPGDDESPITTGVIKGGSYLCAENYCARFRPAARQAHEWGLGASHIGFRTAKSSN